MKYSSSEIDESHCSALLERIAKKDDSAMTELHRMMGRRIYAFALYRLKSPDDAETVVVDTLFEIWKHPTRFRGESRFSTWVLGIARHKMLDVFRERSEPYDDIDEVGETLESPEPEPAVALEHKQQEHAVKLCMGKLTEQHRECLHLVFYEGMSLNEVAQIQNVPENTVKTRLFHARKNIKVCLQRSKGVGS